MLVRIVKMGFYKKNVNDFLMHFEDARTGISHFNGCLFLELYQDEKEPNIYFTLSHWESSEALENYKKSDLYRSTWSKIKPLFSIRPEAWSLCK